MMGQAPPIRSAIKVMQLPTLTLWGRRDFSGNKWICGGQMSNMLMHRQRNQIRTIERHLVFAPAMPMIA